MIYEVRNSFSRIFSVELSPALARTAQSRFRKKAHITVLEGDSASVLHGIIIPQLEAPTLFWLDAHYSGGETNRGTTETPIVDELRLVFERQPAKDVVLIDDARFFGSGDYPSLVVVRRCAEEHGYSFSVENDIIRLAPAPA
jgi:hypothetical protein